MKGTNIKGHGSLGNMPKRSGKNPHGSLGNLSKPGPFMEDATAYAAGKPAATVEGKGKGKAKLPKTRGASFGK